MNTITFIYLYSIFCRCFLKSLTSASLDVTGVNPLYDLCPYTDYCTRNATQSLEDVSKSPCCTYCSCADNCWERGNCCVDKQNLIVKQPLESCVEVLLKNSYGLKPSNLPRYYVIQSCPTPDDLLVDKCSGKHQQSLEDFIWATDERTNKIYNNKYCAECHGLVNYTYWQLATDCIDPMNGQTSRADAINRIIDSCSLTVLPPKSIDVRSNRCLVPNFSTCNATGKWRTTYGKALETACNNFSQIYIRETKTFTDHFKNVYCFLCSVEPRDQIVQDTCMSWRLNDRVGVSGKATLYGFTAILDFTTIEREKDKLTDSVSGQGPVCASDEIQDPFQVYILSPYLNKIFNVVQQAASNVFELKEVK